MNADLNGPIWLIAVGFMLVAVVLALVVLVDSLTPLRRAQAAEGARGRLWTYRVIELVFLISLFLPQVIPGLSVVSVLPVIAAPVAIVAGVAYLLRVVFPRST